MRMMLDQSSTVIHSIRTQEPDLDFLQLRTPLTQYARDSLEVIQYGLDNGSFSQFHPGRFERMARAAKFDPLCLWVVLPDVVGDHYSTLALFHHWLDRIGLDEKRCFVLQDGCDLSHPDNEPPWDLIEAVFVGGTDHYKASRDCYEVVLKAQALGKWIHVGRVNTRFRIAYWFDIADSFDGSGIARFTHMRNDAILALRMLQGTRQLEII